MSQKIIQIDSEGLTLEQHPILLTPAQGGGPPPLPNNLLTLSNAAETDLNAAPSGLLYAYLQKIKAVCLDATGATAFEFRIRAQQGSPNVIHKLMIPTIPVVGQVVEDIFPTPLRSGDKNTDIMVSSATNTTPVAVATALAHGLFPGELSSISGALGNTAINGTHVVVSVPTPTSFVLNISGNGVYGGSGLLTPLRPPRINPFTIQASVATIGTWAIFVNGFYAGYLAAENLTGPFF